MKTFIPFLLLLLFINNGTAQNFTIEKDTVTFTGLATQFEINGRIHLYNNTSSTLQMRCIRTIESLEQGWSTSFCNSTYCFPDVVDSADFTIKANNSNYLLVHYYLNNTAGNAVTKLRVYEAIE